MIAANLPTWAVIPIALLLVIGGLVTLIGSLALLRLKDFFTRLHGPSMGNTIGTGCVLLASMLTSSVLANRPVVHELLITLFILMSSPMTSMMLMRAALYRNRARGRE
jgi:multicomponent K+:H+ antiporter subunit G